MRKPSSRSFLSLVKQEQGFGLLQVMFIFAAVSIPIIASLTLNDHLNRRNHMMGESVALDIFRGNLMSLINDPASIARTIQQNPSMGCLAANNCTIYSNPPLLIDVWDRSSPQAYHPSRSNTKLGFTEKMIPCVNYPSATACPFRYEVSFSGLSNSAPHSWYAIFIKLKVAPYYMGLINPVLYSNAPPDNLWPPPPSGVLPKGMIIKQVP